MSGNTIGTLFKVTTFGQSHGAAVGCVVDGCPPGIKVSLKEIQADLDRRKPGQSIISTSRKEEDKAVIVSGIERGMTTGGPITIMVKNKDIRPSDYDLAAPRPGHADYTYWVKYGFLSTGGGRASGRETIGRVAAGAIAKKLIAPTELVGHVVNVGGIKAKPKKFEEIKRDVEKTIVRCADLNTAKLMIQKIKAVQSKGDSIGGIVEVIAQGVPPGLGEPVFDKLSADLGKALLSIPGVKGIEIGAGFKVAKMKGSQNNDAFVLGKEGIIAKTNNAGGILGGISTGMPIVVRIAVKPTSSISLKQDTVNLKTGKPKKISIKGRHDPCLCPRIVPVAEAMVAIVLADHIIRGNPLSTRRSYGSRGNPLSTRRSYGSRGNPLSTHQKGGFSPSIPSIGSSNRKGSPANGGRMMHLSEGALSTRGGTTPLRSKK